MKKTLLNLVAIFYVFSSSILLEQVKPISNEVIDLQKNQALLLQIKLDNGSIVSKKVIY